MGIQIQDGAGDGKFAQVDSVKRLRTHASTLTLAEVATDNEDSYNLNSGADGLTVTSGNESGLIYFKNNETRSFRIKLIVINLGASTGGTNTKIRIYKNPTTGTLISDGNTSGVISSNRNFGSSNTLADSLVFNAAATDETITDGSVHIATITKPDGRVALPIDELLTKGNAIAVSVETASNTSMLAQSAIIGHLVEAQ